MNEENSKKKNERKIEKLNKNVKWKCEQIHKHILLHVEFSCTRTSQIHSRVAVIEDQNQMEIEKKMERRRKKYIKIPYDQELDRTQLK